jgi:hypothetical protein
MRDKTLGPLVRQYHLMWVNGLVNHLGSTPQEAEGLRTVLARFYYLIVPCDCDKVTYVLDERNPGFMRKA